jgi:tetratricopeptide (TPR) repeat protein
MQPFYAQAVAGLSAYDISKCSEADKKRVSDLFYQALALQDAGKRHEAIAIYLKAYDICPAPNVAIKLGDNFDSLGDSKSAVRWFRLYIEGTTENEKNRGFRDYAAARIDQLTAKSSEKTNWLVPMVLGTSAFLVVIALMKNRGQSLAEA